MNCPKLILSIFFPAAIAPPPHNFHPLSSNFINFYPLSAIFHPFSAVFHHFQQFFMHFQQFFTPFSAIPNAPPLVLPPPLHPLSKLSPVSFPRFCLIFLLGNNEHNVKMRTCPNVQSSLKPGNPCQASTTASPSSLVIEEIQDENT